MPKHATHRSWKDALRALVTPGRTSLRAHVADLPPIDQQVDDEREPFHLDDTGVAARLRRDSGLVHYRTPPHARLVFPTLIGP